MGEQTKNMLIGVFVIASCAVIIWLILFLKPGVGDGKQTIYVRFSSINQINVGTRVLFAGKPVGEVVAIQEIYDARQKPIADVLGEIYCYQLVLKVDSSVKVYDTDEIIVPRWQPETGSRPPVKHVEELIGLGQIGYIKAIHVKLDEIGSEYPEHADFVAQMRSLVDRFDLDQYMATLKTLHSYDH